MARPLANTLAESRGGQDIRCVAQEPRFTQIDKDFCATLGLEAVESPDAFAIVDENTLLFGIHMELQIYNQAMTNLPGIYVGASLKEWEKVVDHQPSSDNPLTCFSAMDTTYDIYSVPDLDYMFSSTIMYWRRGKSSRTSALATHV